MCNLLPFRKDRLLSNAYCAMVLAPVGSKPPLDFTCARMRIFDAAAFDAKSRIFTSPADEVQSDDSDDEDPATTNKVVVEMASNLVNPASSSSTSSSSSSSSRRFFFCTTRRRRSSRPPAAARRRTRCSTRTLPTARGRASRRSGR